jgi:hypothetical protein
MSRYKVLPLPTEFTDEFAEFCYTDPWNRPNKIEPVFNRPGMYFDRKENICWVETTHGCWVLGGRDEFEQELDYQANDEYILHQDVIEAFKVLESHNVLTRSQRELWWRHNYAEQLRDTGRQARKWGINLGQ